MSITTGCELVVAIKVTGIKSPLYQDKKSITGIEISNFFRVITAGSFSRCHLDNKVDRADTGTEGELFLVRILAASHPPNLGWDQ